MAGETPAALREQVRERYAQAARTVLDTASADPGGCCGSAAGGSCCDTGSRVPEEERGIGTLLAVLTHPIPAPARAQIDQAARLAG